MIDFNDLSQFFKNICTGVTSAFIAFINFKNTLFHVKDIAFWVTMQGLGVGAGTTWSSMSFDYLGTFEDICCLIQCSLISVQNSYDIPCLIWTSAVSLLWSPWRYPSSNVYSLSSSGSPATSEPHLTKINQSSSFAAALQFGKFLYCLKFYLLPCTQQSLLGFASFCST